MDTTPENYVKCWVHDYSIHQKQDWECKDDKEIWRLEKKLRTLGAEDAR